MSAESIQRREELAVDGWRAEGGKIEMEDDSKAEEHARVLMTLQVRNHLTCLFFFCGCSDSSIPFKV